MDKWDCKDKATYKSFKRTLSFSLSTPLLYFLLLLVKQQFPEMLVDPVWRYREKEEKREYDQRSS